MYLHTGGAAGLVQLGKSLLRTETIMVRVNNRGYDGALLQ